MKVATATWKRWRWQRRRQRCGGCRLQWLPLAWDDNADDKDDDDDGDDDDDNDNDDDDANDDKA